jgi:hypothetical protein
MKEITVTISIMTDDPTDLRNQNELRLIKEELTECGAELVTVASRASAGSVHKAGQLDVLIGSVKVVLPASAFISILTSFIKNYFDARKKRTLKISRRDGANIQVTGYSAKQVSNLLRQLEAPPAPQKKTRKALVKR